MPSWKVAAVSVLALGGAAFAEDPAATQDPPGKVGVDQPAGVSLGDRNTERDSTDTLRGGGRTDVIDGERADRAAGPDIQASRGTWRRAARGRGARELREWDGLRSGAARRAGAERDRRACAGHAPVHAPRHRHRVRNGDRDAAAQPRALTRFASGAHAQLRLAGTP